MKLAVLGLWHLGAVTAACTAAAGIQTIGLDDDAERIDALSRGESPVQEPCLDRLLQSGIREGHLSFTADLSVLSGVDILWVCHDSPVDEDDKADAAFVTCRIESTFQHLKDGMVVLVSSQLPVGSVGALEKAFATKAAGRIVSFAYSPENLRLGKAVETFQNPVRIIVGVRDRRSQAVLEPLLSLICKNLIWMSVESAEMVKHALNAFLATSITVTNEIARICEYVGADAVDVESGLRSDARIGANAYVRPGPAFAGGTLARDVNFLRDLAQQHDIVVPVIGSVLASNRIHSQWALSQLRRILQGLSGRTVAVLGLSYKPDTNTLRRSGSIELIRALLTEGASVRAFDPHVTALPLDLKNSVSFASDATSAANGADALVVATNCPEFCNLSAADIAGAMAGRFVLDPGRFLNAEFTKEPRLSLITIGHTT